MQPAAWHCVTERYRYAETRDLPAFCAMLADPEVGRWLWFTPAPPETLLAYFTPYLDAQRIARDQGRIPDAAVFVAESSDGTFLGEGAVVPVVGSPDGFEIGYQLRREAWGRGVGTRLARFLVAYAVHLRGAYRIEAGCVEGNLGSRAILERVGLRLEGRRPGFRVIDGMRHAEMLYGALVSELDAAEIAAVARATGLIPDGAKR